MEKANRKDYNAPVEIDQVTGVYAMSHLMAQLFPTGPIRVMPNSIALFINVMNFRFFNRRFSFEGGNGYLRGLGTELKNVFPGDIVARAGGDHFIVLTKDLTDEEITDRLHELDAVMLAHDRGFHMHIKAGICRSSGSEPSFVILIDRAKLACDSINRVYDRDIAFFDEPLRQKNALYQYVVDHFEEAFEQNHFEVYYQPIVRAMTGQVCGYEALARWMDPVHGMISPGVFIEVFENIRVIHRLDCLVIETVCRDIRAAIDNGFNYQPVSFNLSRLDFELCDIRRVIIEKSEKYNIPKGLLHVEVTESAISSSISSMYEQLTALREDGYTVWIDDFGSGYSSFSNLQSYDFDTLKIDMAFIRNLEKNPKSNVIVASIISMAKRLKLPTLAEGVEGKEQYEFLRRIGCEKVQGYYFGKPAPLDAYLVMGEASYQVNENHKFSQYYERLGSLNFLSSSPLRNYEHNHEALTVYNPLPITLIELDHVTGELDFFYYNQAYIKYINSFGISAVDEVVKFFGEDGKKIMFKAFEDAEADPEDRVEFEATVADGTEIFCRVKLLAKEEQRSMFGFVVNRIE